MNIEKERLKKLKEEIKHDLELVKIQAEIRKNNEVKLEEELGLQKSLSKFHQPIINELEKQETSRSRAIEAVKNLVETHVPIEPEKKAIEEYYDVGRFMDQQENLSNQQEGIVTLNLNRELDEELLKKFNFQLPSELVNLDDDKISEIIDKAKERRDQYKRLKGNATKNSETDKIQKYDNVMQMMKKYIHALDTLKRGNYYMGTGLENQLDVLDNLTSKICKGTKSRKIYNNVIHLLDLLLRQGTFTKEQVREYYNKFLL